MKRPGRPRLDASDDTWKMTLRLPGRLYDALHARAHAARVSVPELIRRRLTDDDRKVARQNNRG